MEGPFDRGDVGRVRARLQEMEEAGEVIGFRGGMRTGSTSSFESTDGTGGGSDVSKARRIMVLMQCACLLSVFLCGVS